MGQLEFLSFSEDDIDYKGYEYSITGKLSEVRFVFLYRFIQEVCQFQIVLQIVFNVSFHTMLCCTGRQAVCESGSVY